MTFTYTPAAATDRDRVRFAVGDTVEAEAKLTDEEIAFMISEQSTWQAATIACIQFIIARLSQPDFSADWLKVSHGEAIKGYKGLLLEKRREYGITSLSASVTHVYRVDSDATEEPYT